MTQVVSAATRAYPNAVGLVTAAAYPHEAELKDVVAHPGSEAAVEARNAVE